MSDPEYRMKKYRMKKTLQFEKIKKEEKARVLEEKRSEAKERQRKCRDNGLNLFLQHHVSVATLQISL